MARFFVESIAPTDQFLVLEGENAAHAKVLRLKSGEAVTVCDGKGTDYACVVSDVSNGRISLVVQRVNASESEPKIAATIYMGFSKADKFEHVIQKATELGASKIVAFPCRRCVARPDEKSLAKKIERWQKIAASAAEQSGRGRIPEVTALPSFEAMLKQAAAAELPVLFYENERARTFQSAIQAGPFQSAALITGPEGGFEAGEVAQAEAAGLHICTLGSRILRCETAPLCALSALMYAAGEY